MRMNPRYVMTGFVHHISTECKGWKEAVKITGGAIVDGTGDKPECSACVRLLQRGKG